MAGEQPHSGTATETAPHICKRSQVEDYRLWYQLFAYQSCEQPAHPGEQGHCKDKKKKKYSKKILLLPRGAKETQRESPRGAAARRDSGEGTGGDMGTSPSCCATLGPHEPLGKISQAVEHPQGSVPTEHPITRARRAGGLQTLSTKPPGPPRPRGARTKAPGSSLAPGPRPPRHIFAAAIADIRRILPDKKKIQAAQSFPFCQLHP